MELVLYDFVYCAKQLGTELLRKLFTVITDYKNLVYQSNSSIPKLTGALESHSLEVLFVIEHIPDDQNIVTDVTR